MLSRRSLGRATLRRQLLLERADLGVGAAVEHVLGLNAQDPDPPYLALWNRLDGFAIDDLTQALVDGELVRSTMMRATQHIVTVGDFRLLRPLLGDLLRRVQRNGWGSRTAGVDLDALVADARELLAGGEVMTRAELGRALAASRPGTNATALAWTVQYLLPVVHPAPSGTWRTYGPTSYALADGPVGRTDGLDPGLAIEEMVRRYLAAFGPATPTDARAWSGVTGLREVFDRLRPELRTFADEAGRQLYDLPDAPLPDPDEPAPVRLLPRFDGPVLAHADRTRTMSDEVRRRVIDGAAVEPVVLVDGTVASTWVAAMSVDGGPATVMVRPLRALSPAERDDVEAEALRLLAFTDPDAAEHRVEIEPLPG